MRAILLGLSVFVTGLACGRERAKNVQEALGGAATIHEIEAAGEMALCLRPFEGDAEKQELSNTRESAAIRLTPDEVGRLRSALVDPRNYTFGVAIDCWRYSYARLKISDDVVIDFCPLCGIISVKRDGAVIGSGVFEKGVAVLDELLLRSFPEDKILASMKRFIEPNLKKPNQSLEPTPAAGTSAAEQPLVPAAVVAHL